MFLRVFKQRLTDNFIPDWNEQISNSSRANTYKLIANFNFKCYLDVVIIRKFRYAFTRLRVASHRLETGAGRRHKPKRTPVEETKCHFCRNWLCSSVLHSVSFWNGRFNLPISNGLFTFGMKLLFLSWMFWISIKRRQKLLLRLELLLRHEFYATGIDYKCQAWFFQQNCLVCSWRTLFRKLLR